MEFCPQCNTELPPGAPYCHVCGKEFTSEEWVVLGIVEDKLTADLARELLRSRNIPSVVFSRSGFFGDAGLPLPSIFKPDNPFFEVTVPADQAEEAASILDMTIGSGWKRKED